MKNFILLGLFVFLLAGCAHTPTTNISRTPTTSTPPSSPSETDINIHENTPESLNIDDYQIKSHGYHAVGLASWYGKEFAGKKTASGQRFNPQAMTAAHRSLPFFSYVKVTNLKNNKSVIVQINDRGPFTKGRIIDLSYAAAGKLGLHNRGTFRVKVETVVPKTEKHKTSYKKTTHNTRHKKIKHKK